jgi:hypothetical protein
VSSSSPISPAVDHLADLALWEAELATDPLSVPSSLLNRLGQVPDPRRLRGLRHRLVVILVLTACATLVVGNDSVAAIPQWAAGTPQDVLHRIGARFDPLLSRYTVPSERTFRRVLAGLDGDALDTATCGYAADVVRGDAPVPVIAATAGPVEREQRRAEKRAVIHPWPAGRRGRRETPARDPHPDRAGVPGRGDHPPRRRDPGPTPGPGQTRREHGGRRPAGTAGRGRDDADLGRTAHDEEDRPPDHRGARRPLPSGLEGESAPCLPGRPGAATRYRPTPSSPTTRTSTTTGDTGAPNVGPYAPHPPMTACSPAPGKSSGSAVTPADSTVSTPAKKSSTASSACPPTKPARTTSTTTRGALVRGEPPALGPGRDFSRR